MKSKVSLKCIHCVQKHHASINQFTKLSPYHPAVCPAIFVHDLHVHPHFLLFAHLSPLSSMAESHKVPDCIKAHLHLKKNRMQSTPMLVHLLINTLWRPFSVSNVSQKCSRHSPSLLFFDDFDLVQSFSF